MDASNKERDLDPRSSILDLTVSNRVDTEPAGLSGGHLGPASLYGGSTPSLAGASSLSNGPRSLTGGTRV